MAFNHESTTDDVIAGIDLTGKIAVVTGASAGLGIETCRVLAGAGARVVMLARDQDKLIAALDAITENLPDAHISTQLMDLADLESIRGASERLLGELPRIDLLINNAGVMACPRAKTKDGFELQFGTNHIGHFLFTCLVAPLLVSGAPARVVNLSSAGHRFSAMDFDDPNFAQRDYDKWVAYGQSKTANALFSVGLNRRLADRGITANAVHPGMIVTELGRHLDQADIEALQARASTMTVGFKTIPQGAATSVWAATSPDLEGRGGLYLEDCHIAEPATEDSPGGVHDYALDADAAERLWALSEQLIGEKFDLGA
jgi:NAD(P)-dependent dehydrogenase (short-subunit alcohol dehydrogenase family)